MPLGPGKYDAILTTARERAGAKCALLIIHDGIKGGGFSAQGTPEFIANLPALLRIVADQMEGIEE